MLFPLCVGSKHFSPANVRLVSGKYLFAPTVDVLFGLIEKCPKKVVSKEYSTEWKDGMEPYYPINDTENNTLYQKYKALADQESQYLFGGRLAEYKYYDMAPIVELVLQRTSILF